MISVKKKFIIKKNYDIEKIIFEKNSYSNKYFIVYKKHNNIDHFRFVVSVGKKVGKAVIRNKIKRQIKAIIYQKKCEIIGNYDILLIVRPTVTCLSYEDMEKQLMDVIIKAKLINV